MNPIYNFDAVRPPAVTLEQLEQAQQCRILRRQTILLGVAALLVFACLVLLGLLLLRDYPALSVVCAAAACGMLCGDGLIALVFAQKRFSVETQI